MSPIQIRSATPSDVFQLPRLEIVGGDIFRTVGMVAIADDAPPALALFQASQETGHIWVATTQTSASSPDDVQKIVGYVEIHLLQLAEGQPQSAHIQQVTVSPEFAGQRIGARLVQHVEAWAMEQRFENISLTTFRDVPWNAPYYQRLGFSVVGDEELLEAKNAALKDVVDKELKVDILAKWPRVAMRKSLKSVNKIKSAENEPASVLR
ncbi:MAG: hypothetical protein Q9160_003899 [Pyrenula sp. 1 TL-2023]